MTQISGVSSLSQVAEGRRMTVDPSDDGFTPGLCCKSVYRYSLPSISRRCMDARPLVYTLVSL